MGLLLLKLCLTPLLIGGASLAARRWGPSVGGWLVALPLTSGPVALYLALDQGTRFAAAAADGSLGGLLGDATFALIYAWVANRGAPGPAEAAAAGAPAGTPPGGGRGAQAGSGRPIAVHATWLAALLAGSAAFAATALAIQPLLGPATGVLLAVVLAGMAVALWLAPRSVAAAESVALPGWDIPARMMVGTAIVLAITQTASVAGPHLSGVLATFPVYVSVLAVFAHRLAGPDQAIGTLRGLQMGLFGTAVFLAALALLLDSAGVAVAFGAAIVFSGCAQAAVVLLRRYRAAQSRGGA